LNLLNIMKAYQSIEDKKHRKTIRNKKYIENNKEKIKEIKQKYYDKTKNIDKETKLEKRRETYNNVYKKNYKKQICEICKCEVVQYGLIRHQKSKKCIKIKDET